MFEYCGNIILVPAYITYPILNVFTDNIGEFRIKEEMNEVIL